MPQDSNGKQRERGSGLGKVSGKQRVTMQDISRIAGCSQSTVSFVLNANTSVKISEPTRRRVLEVARELGYRPASLPGLNRNRGRSEGTIAFVIDKISTSPEGIVALDGVRQIARNLGAIVLVAETDGDPMLEPRTLEMFIEMGVQAIIYACIFTREVSLPNALVETTTPVVLLNCYTPDGQRPAVVPGEIAGGHRATAALLAAGHRRVGTITGEVFMEATRDRLQGYRNALATADIPFAPELVVEGDWSASAGYRGTRKLMALDQPPTAIFCQNDRMAVGCYEALKEMGKRIPEDISVVGYDDEEIARHLSPPLTSLILPSRAMGRWCVERIMQGDMESDDAGALVKLECELVERDSIAPPPEAV
ncbi:LacI family DNA-binding transcriptional regulator [Aliiruegeria lutimaris]|uniref:Transcriptional regulator, LacI family n=1 Tax=Aliiruegeria lutimaris TaxID=571298 RepID=A0A1G8JY24_9RHOB|nr:LacI family DNA-binding transcriptional regulator [Aliiruegeria lutimaris]SDI36075.1 transcriptional regulator, LacI family [Aliiruegeria lutimaris]